MTNSNQNNSHLKGLLFACCTALCWAFLAILLKKALVFTDSKSIIGFRMIFAFLCSLPLFAFSKPHKLKILYSPPLLLIFGSLGLAYNYLGFMKGVELSGASNAQVMIQFGPLLLMLSGFLLYKEVLRWPQSLALTLSFIGFALFFKDQLNFAQSPHLISANLWVLSAALSWVGYSLVIKYFTQQGYDSSELNLVVFLSCAIILSLGVDWPKVLSFSFYNWLFLLILGLNTLVAYGCFGAALKYAPASQVSIIITSNPILTLIIIYFGSKFTPWVDYEPVSSLGYLGAFLVITGIILFTLFAKKKAKSKA